MSDAPIEVHTTPLPDQLWAAARTVIIIGSTFALGRGWIKDDVASVLAGMIGVVWPIVAGQLKTRRRAVELTTLEPHVDDAIAVAKP